MQIFFKRIFLFCLIFGCFLVPHQAAFAKTKYKNFQIAKGVAIYLGVIPAALIEEQDIENEKDAEKNKAIGIDNHKYHITVALFDSETGKRIKDARVWGRLSENWFSGRTKQLEQLTIANTISYGNYFELPDEGPYQIQIQIHLPEEDKVIKANFEYLNIWASQN